MKVRSEVQVPIKKLYFFGVVSLRSRRGSTLLRFIEEKMSTSLVFCHFVNFFVPFFLG